MNKSKSPSLLSILMLGIFVTATGVSAGDLTTAHFTDSQTIKTPA